MWHWKIALVLMPLAHIVFRLEPLTGPTMALCINHVITIMFKFIHTMYTIRCALIVRRNLCDVQAILLSQSNRGPLNIFP